MSADNLLLCLSAMGSGSWRQYRKAIDNIFADYDGDAHGEDGVEVGQMPIRHIVKHNLQVSGHIEFMNGDGYDWFAVPPTLACHSGAEMSTAVVCGARTEQIHLLLEQHCPPRSRVSAQQITDISVWRFAYECLGDAAEVAELCGLKLQPEAPRCILQALPNVESRQHEYERELPFGNDWTVAKFCRDTFRWQSTDARAARSSKSGLFRFTYFGSNDYYLIDGDRSVQVPVQIGKFRLLRKKRLMSFDPASRTLSLPVHCRPPMLVERALILCSGMFPQLDDGRLVYREISRDIAATTAAIIRQRIK